MKNALFIVGVIITSFLWSCGFQESVKHYDSVSIKAEDELGGYTASIVSMPVHEADQSKVSYTSFKEAEIPADKKKIIKNGEITIKTIDVAAGKKKIDALIAKHGAYYDVEELKNDDNKILYILKIRIPANNFEKLIAELENSKNEIVYKRIHARDVTEEYVDIEGRLKSKRECLLRYNEILKKAVTIKDILELEENIGTLQEEIESQQGKLKYLNDQVVYSTLTIEIYTDKPYVFRPQQIPGFTEGVKASLASGGQLVLNTILAIISIWPLMLLLFAIIMLIIWKIAKKRRAISG